MSVIKSVISAQLVLLVWVCACANAAKNDPEALPVKATTDSPNLKGDEISGVEIKNNLPVFYEKLEERLTFPMSWLSGNYSDFNQWKKSAREKVFASLLSKPPAVPFEPELVAQEDRGTYTAKKILLNITKDSRILAYMLEPKGKGPFLAVLLLHDHGAKFEIGKEKVIKPFGDPRKLQIARDWVNQLYDGIFLGDELAKRGYVCFATDALNWSDRGGAGFEGQQALASNLMHLGYSLSGLIAYEDLRAAEFMAEQPIIKAGRIGAVGLSFGGFRTWQLCALSDHIAAGAAVCWMATVKGLMQPGNNQTVGQSAFTMLHPGLLNYLDYPDIAGISCPKPMLFYNGAQDPLFPVTSVNDAYAKLHTIWKSQNAPDNLETKLWDAPHVFNKPMQKEAFAWLDKHLKTNCEKKGR